MINNINELINFQTSEFNNLGKKEFHKDLLIYTPGCSEDMINKLYMHIPSIPISYTKMIKGIDINGTILGIFSISPISGRNKSIIEKLIITYEDPFFPKEFMQKHKMYQIGSYNTDILCVTEGTDQFHEGEILYIDEGYDIYNPEDDQIHPIAKDFEQFLIVAGNLDQIHTEMQGDDALYEPKKAEFLGRLRALGVDEKYDSAWLNVF